MRECKCLVIDDRKGFINSSFITNFSDDVLKKHDLKINFIQLNPKESKFIDSEGIVIPGNIIKELDSKEYLRQSIQLIICDYNFDDEKVNGFELIRLLRKNLKTQKRILLYSSNIHNVIDKIISIENKKEIINKVADLVKVNISECCERDEHLLNSILRHLIEETVFSIDNFLIEQLYKHRDLKFNLIYDKFQGKTLGEVADIISNHPGEGDRLKKEFIEQLVALMVQLDN